MGMLSGTIRLNLPLTPSDGEREKISERVPAFSRGARLRSVSSRPKIFWAVFALLGFFQQAVPAAPTKQQIEAAFLYNFAKFVEWPERSFTNAASPVVIGVLGKDPFGKDLEATVGDQLINGRKIKIERYENLAAVGVCHILFISTGEKLDTEEKGRLKDTFAKLKDRNILTVGEAGQEADGFAAAGGIINFRVVESKVNFEINPDAAGRSGLKLSSKLLKLARIVQDATEQR